MCRLLLEYGVKSEITTRDESPLSLALMYTDNALSPSFANIIDTYRCFLDDADLFDELNRVERKATFDFLIRSSIDESQWLWQKNLESLTSEDLRSNQRMLIRRFWSSVAHSISRFKSRHEIQFPDFSMNKDTLSDIQYGRCQIFRIVFPVCEEAMSSYIVGTRFLDWLVNLDLDLELCVAREQANLESSGLADDKMIVFERNWEQRWVLGFEWVFDHQAPGYSLLSEYPTLTAEPKWPCYWPFFDWLPWKDRSALFNRRVAVKDRKEHARLGKKQPRSRMPGAWKW